MVYKQGNFGTFLEKSAEIFSDFSSLLLNLLEKFAICQKAWSTGLIYNVHILGSYTS